MSNFFREGPQLYLQREEAFADDTLLVMQSGHTHLRPPRFDWKSLCNHPEGEDQVPNSQMSFVPDDHKAGPTDLQYQ